MKKYEIISMMDDNSSIITGVAYIGTTADIKALCKSIRRASEKESTNLYFLFGGAVRFSENKQVYGLVISDDDTVTIITSDTFAMMLVSGELKDVTQFLWWTQIITLVIMKDIFLLSLSIEVINQYILI